MPWDIFKDENQYCVHKRKPDGSKGEKEGCHSSRSKAEDQLAALHASEEKDMKLIDFLVKAIDEEAKEEIKAILEEKANKEPEVLKLLGKEEFEKADLEKLENVFKEVVEDENMIGVFQKALESEEIEEKMVGESYAIPSIEANTFEELEAERKLEVKREKFQQASNDFMNLFENIVYYSDMPMAEKGTRVMQLANEYADKIEREFAEKSIEETVEETIEKQEGIIEKLAGRVVEFFNRKDDPQEDSFMLFKDDAGDLRWIARYSNNFRDDEAEIIAEKSHRRFVDLVDKGLAPYPELLVWHEKEWRLGEADWIAYDDAGFALASGTIDKEVEEVALWLSKQKDIRTSHGMPISTIKRDKEDQSVIVEHESREVSILPKQRAANKITGWYVIEKEQEDNRMAIPKEKKEKLQKDWGVGSELLSGLEHLNKADAEAAEEEGIDRKDIDEVDEEAPEEEVSEVKEEEETPADEVEEKEYVTKDEVAETITTVVKSLVEKIDSNFEQVHNRIEEINGNVEKEVENKLSSTPTASLAAMVAKGLSVTNEGSEDLDDVKVDGRSSLAKSKPNETKEQDPGQIGVPFIDEMLSQEGVE